MGYSRNFDRRKISFITTLGWNPSESHLVLKNDPAAEFDFIWPEPVSRVEIYIVSTVLSDVNTRNKIGGM